MYEIWLVMNILWEMLLSHVALVAGAAVLWAVVLFSALRRRGAGWGRGLPVALLAGVAVAALAFVVLPSALGSSFGDMGYWLDWANLLGIAGACGAVAVAFAWPLLAMRSAARTA